MKINFTFVPDVSFCIYIGEFENMNHRTLREINIGL